MTSLKGGSTLQPVLALLHTTLMTIPIMKDLTATHLSDVRTINLMDDSLLEELLAAGGVTPAVNHRLENYVEQAAVAGATGVLCCCSSVGEVIEGLESEASIPAWRIDAPMAEEAVRKGNRVGVIATVRTTLDPTARLVERKAKELQSPVKVEAVLVEGAFDALRAGRGEEHDHKVLQALEALCERSDVVLLAQASMARLLDSLSEEPRVPVLTSPLSGVLTAGAAVRELVEKPRRSV